MFKLYSYHIEMMKKSYFVQRPMFEVAYDDKNSFVVFSPMINHLNRIKLRCTDEEIMDINILTSTANKELNAYIDQKIEQGFFHEFDCCSKSNETLSKINIKLISEYRNDLAKRFVV